jgi:hypothetical protein
MDPNPSLPPLPPQPPRAQSKKWLIIVALVVCFVLAAFVAVGLGGFFLYQKVKEEQARKIAVEREIEQAQHEENAKTAEALRNGQNPDATAALGRMRSELDKAAQLGGADGEGARALSNFVAKMGRQTADYQKAAEKLQSSRVIAWDIHDRAGLEESRQVVADFAAQNARLSALLETAEQGLGAELDAIHASPRTRKTTVDSFMVGFAKTRPAQIRIRACDKQMADAMLAILDLLDANWGKWKKDPGGKVVFQGGGALTEFNEQIKKIQAAAAEQAAAQKEMAETMSANSTK